MFQQTTIIGYLGSDPEMRYTSTGTSVASFSVATKKTWTSNDGSRQEKTVWFRVSAWQKQAEVVSQYLKKGSKIHIIGELEEPRVFQDRSGEWRSSLEMRLLSFTFLDSKSDSQPQSGYEAVAPPAKTQQQTARPEIVDEDVPF